MNAIEGVPNFGHMARFFDIIGVYDHATLFDNIVQMTGMQRSQTGETP